MSKWVRTLDIVQEWKEVNEDESLVYKTCDAIAKKLKAFKIVDDYELEDLIYSFEMMSLDPSTNYENFNADMNDLYNWADISLDNHFGGKKNCWIKTF